MSGHNPQSFSSVPLSRFTFLHFCTLPAIVPAPFLNRSSMVTYHKRNGKAKPSKAIEISSTLIFHWVGSHISSERGGGRQAPEEPHFNRRPFAPAASNYNGGGEVKYFSGQGGGSPLNLSVSHVGLFANVRFVSNFTQASAWCAKLLTRSRKEGHSVPSCHFSLVAHFVLAN